MNDLSRSYQILEIQPPASEEQIKRAYRDLVKVWHPDRFTHDEQLRQKAQDKLKEINGAYQVLLANLFAAGTDPNAAPGPPPQNPPQPDAPKAAPARTGTRRTLWVSLAVIAPLLLAAALFTYWKKSHAGGALPLNPAAASSSNPAAVPTANPAAAPTASNQDWRRGLILDFNFDKKPAAGKITDLSDHGNNGEASGVKWVAEGPQGGSLEFGPGESYIRVSNNESLNPPQFTLAAWIRTTQKGPTWRRIFDKGSWDKSVSEQGYDLTMGGDADGKSYQGKVLLEVSARAPVSKVDVTDGKWHHVAGTFDGRRMLLYVDGQLSAKNHVTKPMKTTSYDLAIGNTCSNPPNEPDTAGFIGRMNNVMIYDHALSDEEIHELFRSQGGDRIEALKPP
jgi:hypothetical protein